MLNKSNTRNRIGFIHYQHQEPVPVSHFQPTPYIMLLQKAFDDFIQEEITAQNCAELRLMDKIKAARTLFPDLKNRI